MAATFDELSATKDIGPRIAESIIEYFNNPRNRRMVERLRRVGLQMSMPETEEGEASDRLGGKAFVISGTFSRHSRDEYKELIERNGGRNVGSISKKTDYVLAGENMGPAKREKAAALGIPVIDEDTFLAMISGE